MRLRLSPLSVVLPALFLAACGASGAADGADVGGGERTTAEAGASGAPGTASDAGSGAGSDAGTGSGSGSGSGGAAVDAGGKVQDAGSSAGPSPAPDGGSGGGASGGSSSGGGVVPTPGAPRRIVGYYTSWSVYGRNFQPADANAALLTHVNYAFANVDAQGRCVLGDPYADVDKFYPGDSWDADALRGAIHQWHLVRARTPGLKLMLSVGGWTWSRNFSTTALTASGRAGFATSCVALAKRYGFDGLDIDWEYPVGGGDASTVSRPEDRQNFTLLLRALRQELDAQGARDGRRYELSAALGASPQLLGNLELGAVGQALDFVNLMTYDYHGGWEMQTGMNAPLRAATGDPFVHAATWNLAAAVQYTIAAGVPRAKIQPGLPFYGRGWSGVGPTNNGLFQPATGLPTGTWEPGVFDYKDLVANYIPTMTRHWDANAQVPFLYDPVRRLFITYDDPQSLRAKADYAIAEGLGGIMFWELSSDTAQKELLTVVHQRLRP